MSAVLRLNSETFPIGTAELSTFENAGVEITACERFEAGMNLSSYNALAVVAAKVPASAVHQLTQCRVIARYGIGIDNIDVEEATQAGILITNVPDFCLSEMADHTMALLLALSRKLLIMDRCAREGKWQARVQIPTRRVAGKTLGLIGFGRIAQAVAKRAAAFDLNLVCFDTQIDAAAAQHLGVRAMALDDLLRASDFVSVHVPLSPTTCHMIGERELHLMKNSAYLINTARGGVVDEAALVRALDQGQITGAGIDVFEDLAMFDPQPTETDHPFFHRKTVIVTPHSGGCSVEALEYVASQSARQIVNALSGEWPPNCINPLVSPRFPMKRVAAAGLSQSL